MSKLIYKILIWSSAADRTILDLDECKHAEHIKQASIGILLFITASVAAVAGGYMFYLVLQNTLLGYLLGFFWGVIFFFIDRSVVSTMRKRDGMFKKDLLLASPRLLLACLSAIFVSYGMDLKFFESDINVEMSNHSDSLITKYITTNNDYLDNAFENNIKSLKNEIQDSKENLPKELQLIITDYEDSKKEYELLNRELTIANNSYIQQIKNIKSKYLTENGISTQDNDRLKNLYSSVSANNIRIQNAYRKFADLGKQRELRLQMHQRFSDSLQIRNNLRIGKIEKGKDTAASYFNVAQKEKDRLLKENTKLSARIASLDRSTDFKTHYSNWKTYWQIFLLFLSIELLPVLTKLFMWRGPYDYLLEAKENKIELETKAKRIFFSSDEFSNITLGTIKLESQSKSQVDRVKTVSKISEDFMDLYAKDHTKFKEFIQKRLSEISNMDTSLSEQIKNRELDALNKMIDVYYKNSDKSFNEFIRDI